MALPIVLELLTKGARAALPMITSLAGTDLSANEILRQVSGAGFSLRRQTGLDMIGALRDNITAARQFRMIASNALPNPAYFGKSLTNMLKDYSYRVKVTGGPSTYPDFISIKSDLLLTKEQQISAAMAYLSNAERYGMLEEEENPVTYEPVDALANSYRGV